jgi:hypothetical protein
MPPVVVLGLSKRMVLVWSQVDRDGPLAELLGQRDDDPLGAADVAEPVAVLVLRLLSNELRAVGSQSGDSGIDVVDGSLRLVRTVLAVPRTLPATGAFGVDRAVFGV